MIISKIRKQGVQKIVCIPKKSKLESGDYVYIEKINPKKDSPMELSPNNCSIGGLPLTKDDKTRQV